jgi:hypothetical protein
MRQDRWETVLRRGIQALTTADTMAGESLTCFDRALLLHALPPVLDLAPLRRKLAEQADEQLTTKWIRSHDAADVFLVLATLWSYDAARVSNEHFVHAIHRLIASELQPGGPYQTSTTLDARENIAIALFMHQAVAPPPQLQLYLKKVVAAARFQPSDPDNLKLLYLLIHAQPEPELTAYIAKRWQQKNWQHSAGQSLALFALQDTLSAQYFTKNLQTLCRHQQADGLWSGGVSEDKEKVSELLVTSLVLRLILRQQEHISRALLKKRQLLIARTAKQTFGRYSEPLRSTAINLVEQLQKSDTNFEITLIAYFFGQALQRPSRDLSQHYHTLGLANFYMWLAYTIYDDFIDDEGQPQRLPVANIALRATLDQYHRALPNKHFQRYINNTFAAMDEANAWEVKHCRFPVEAGHITIACLPQYGSGALLAARAFAHALPAMTVLAHNPCTRRQKRHVETAFRHYLIARQLNDDLHDWQKDIRAGQASYVVTAILRDLRMIPGTHALPELIERMQKRFRHRTMPRISHKIVWHLDRSRQAF